MANPMMLTDMVTLYVKPSLGGQIIMRKPRTNQKSERVKMAQQKFAEKAKGQKIATACKGKKGRGFYGCLRTEGYRVFH
jgi:hypothetical protein